MISWNKGEGDLRKKGDRPKIGSMTVLDYNNIVIKGTEIKGTNHIMEQ